MNIENGSIFTVPVIILHTRCIFQKRMQVAKQLLQEPQKQKKQKQKLLKKFLILLRCLYCYLLNVHFSNETLTVIFQPRLSIRGSLYIDRKVLDI